LFQRNYNFYGWPTPISLTYEKVSCEADRWDYAQKL
jgi:hypothetical protein